MRDTRVQVVVINLFYLFFVIKIFQNIDIFSLNLIQWKQFCSLSCSNWSISNLALLYSIFYIPSRYLSFSRRTTRMLLLDFWMMIFLLLLRLFNTNRSFIRPKLSNFLSLLGILILLISLNNNSKGNMCSA